MAEKKKSTGHVDKKASAKRGLTRKAASKINHKSKKAVKTVHHHVAKRPHIFLHQKYSWYRRWHSWQWRRLNHSHVHGVVALSWLIAAVIIVTSNLGSVYAATTWTQTDWSGGVGTNTANQYSAASSIDTSSAGEIKLSAKPSWANGLDDWMYRRKVTFDNTVSNLGVNSENLDNFPALIKLDSGSDIDYTKTKDQGEDIRIVDSDGTLLDYEIERWDESGTSYIWAKVPQINQNSNTDHVYVYYGNSSASDAQDANQVWSGSHSLVYHFNESSGTSGSGSVIDSTNNTSGTPSAGIAFDQAGKIGKTAEFSGGTGIDLGSLGSPLLTPATSISFWINPTSFSSPSRQNPFNQAYGGWGTMTIETSGSIRWFFGSNGGDSQSYGQHASNNSTISNSNWIHITAVRNPSNHTYRWYKNGQYLNGSSYNATYPVTVDRNFIIGDGYVNPINGRLDEFRVSNVARSDAWVAAQYASDSDLLAVIESEESVYSNSGTLTSAIYDLSFGGDWDTLTYTTDNASATTVKVRTSNDPSMSGAPAFAGCPAIASGTDLTGQTCMTDNNRYVQYEITLNEDNSTTPVVEDISVQYDPYDNDVPITNASSISMAKTNGGSALTSNAWTNGSSPYFAWTAGADNIGGSGVLGYCVYLGTDNNADPVTTKGMLGVSPTTNSNCPFVVSGNSLDLATAGLLQTALYTRTDPYYLNLKVIDVAGNVYSGSPEQFQFRFDNTPPTNPAFVTTPSQYISSKSTTMTWPTTGGSAPSDANSGVHGLQYQIEATGWYGDNHTGSGDVDDLLINDGSYTTTAPNAPDEANLNDGVNTVYLRTWDQAGNLSVSTVSAAIKINTSSAPSAPQGVGATPSISATNSFAFNWSEPASFLGSAGNLVYCYTINALPSLNSCAFTPAGVTNLTADAYANQPGENTLYVVAKDESGNLNYSNYASVSFFANTPAPGIPLNTDIADVSVKATNNWRLAITWDEPSSVGAGVQSYKIYRSTDNANFSVVGSNSSTSYVDAGLSQQKYYYRVKACDSANNCGADSATVNEIPTGKYTSPASITSEPKVSNITTKRATISWSTERDSDSKIAIGTSSNKYSPSEIGNSDQVTSHSIDLDNLAAGTTYYFKAKWADEDGNIGSSQEYTFKTAPAPVLKEVDTISIGLSTATIEFTTKDAVKVDLNFGQNEAFGGVKTINTSAEESTYQIALAGLNDGTKYLYKISLYDSEGGIYPSSIFSFTTPPRPSITNLRFQPIKGEPTSTQKVTWTTNVPTTSIIEYTKIGASARNIQTSKLITSHSIIIKGLEDSSKYSLIAQGRDNAGNLAVSDRQVFETALDTRPPEISDVVVELSVRGSGAESRGQIVVSWKTDEPSSSQVAFGEGSNVASFNNRTGEDNQLTTEHLVIVSDLPPSKVYSIAPVSKDKAGNQTTADSQAAIIGRATDSVLSIVLNTLKNVFGL